MNIFPEEAWLLIVDDPDSKWPREPESCQIYATEEAAKAKRKELANLRVGTAIIHVRPKMNEKILSHMSGADLDFHARQVIALRQEIAELRTLLEETSGALYFYTSNLEYDQRRKVNDLRNRINVKLAEPAP